VNWRRTPKKGCGVIVGCDRGQEWLLPWWWERYSAENAFPVTFVDFGMSQEAMQWCAQHGELVAIDSVPAQSKTKDCIHASINLDQDYGVTYWNGSYDALLLEARMHWFKKPFACLCASYEKNIWFDLDCEILGPIDSLFAASKCELALVRDHDARHLPLYHPLVFYNGGVIAFHHGGSIIEKWAEAVLERSGSFWGDDVLLSTLIYELKPAIVELPDTCNWHRFSELNIHALVYHWMHKSGKDYIKKYGGIKSALQTFFTGIHGMRVG
jgi:hypothetical protein